MEKICPICESKNIERAKFCCNCGFQLNCISCNEEILVGANNCISCGTAIKQKESTTTKQAAINTIDFHQTKDERSIKVAFTNEAAKEVRESIVQMSNMRANNIKFIEQGASQQNNSEEFNDLINETVDIPSEEIRSVADNTGNTNAIPHLNDIQKLQCSEAEWILIMAFYKSNSGNVRFNKEDVRTLYNEHRQTASRMKNYASNWNSLFGTQKGLIVTIKDNLFELTDSAKQKISQLITGEVKGNAGTVKKTGKRKGEAVPNNETNELEQKADKKRAPAKASALSLVTHLNLNPSGKQSLKAFYNSYKVSNKDNENNLIIVYYLERIIAHKLININCVYTGYKHIGLKVPTNLNQSLRNTKFHKGWIDTADLNDIKIIVTGENYLEHDMPKA